MKYVGGFAGYVALMEAPATYWDDIMIAMSGEVEASTIDALKAEQKSRITASG